MKKILIALLGLYATSCFAYYVPAAGSSSNIQPQFKTMVIFTPGAMAEAGPMVTTNSDLSYQLLNNQHGVGTELILLKAQQNNQLTSPITAGGMIEVDTTYDQQTNNY